MIKLGKKQHYRIRVSTLDEESWVDILGYGVVLPGFEEYEFFVHRGYHPYEEEWRLSEATTGFAFPSDCDATTWQGVIKKVIALLVQGGKPALTKELNRAKKLIEQG